MAEAAAIDEAERDEVFRPFYRLAHWRNPETGGTGLGLAIVSKIMEDHAGEFYLSDRSEGGALAMLRFPIIRRDAYSNDAKKMDSEA